MTEEGTRESDRGGAELRLLKDEPLGRALVDAIHAGEVDRVRELIAENRGLAAACLVDDKGGSATPLHAATDWPGYFPNGPEIVSVLIGAGVDPNMLLREAGTPRRRCIEQRVATTSKWPEP